jgi:hypothetical protein
VKAKTPDGSRHAAKVTTPLFEKNTNAIQLRMLIIAKKSLTCQPILLQVTEFSLAHGQDGQKGMPW